MTDLNLNFDSGIKSVTMGSTSNDNITVSNQNTNQNTIQNTIQTVNQNSPPNLTVSDPVGIEFLAKGAQTPQPTTSDNSPKSTKSEEFTFFKPSPPEKVETDISNDDMIANPKQVENSEFKPIHRLTPQDIKNEKIDLLYKFKKLEGQGIRTTMNYNMNSHLDDMRNEYIKLKKQREVEASVKFQRKIMMAAITGVEFLNTKFDPFSVQLNGWSESVNENIYDYDEVFEELYEKYGGAGEMAPEIKLLLMLGGSGFMFHLSKTMFNTGLPGMGDIMKDNPDLMKKFAKAAMGNAMGIDPSQNSKNKRPEMNGPPNDIDEIISDMNLQPNNVDLDNISIISDGSIKLDF